MNRRNGLVRAVVAIALAVGMANESGAQTLQGTAFTYQGELRQSGSAVSGSVDLVFQLYDAPSGGNQVGATLDFTAGNGNPVMVSNGIFTVALDFGALAFNTLASNERYLKVIVNGTPLAPRTKIESAPYALQSRTAELAYSVSAASVGTAQIVPAQVQQRVTGTCTVGASIQSIAEDGTVTCQDSGSGTVTSVGSGSGLTGGPITGSGTLAVDNTVQRRTIAPSCVTGQVLRVIAADGTPTCVAMSSGTVSSVGSGTGLTGGPITGSGTLAVDTAAIQTRITGTCSAGQKVLAVNADGTVVCANDATGGSGTVTSVGSGSGLTGGPITGSGTLAVDTSVIQARVGGTCAPGQYVRGINADGSVVCASIQWITTVDASINAGYYTSIAIGDDGLPVVSYINGGGGSDLKVAQCSSTNCNTGATITAVDTAGSVGHFPSIAIGNDGLPVVSYHDDTNGDLKVAHCVDTACSGVATISAVDTAGNVGVTTSIAIGNDGLPVVSYGDNTNGDLKVARCANAACTSGATITTLDATGSVGYYSSIAIGTDNWPVMSYYDETNGDLKVAHCSNAACTAATITAVDTAGDVGMESSIAIGTDGWPVVSYYDITGFNLKVAHCSNATCTAATLTAVDTAGDVGRWPSIAIGTDGLPVVSYSDFTNKDLKVAHCSNAACTAATITTVDSAGFVGHYSSIAIGNDGLPVVSYQDNGNIVLKVLKCINRFCQ